MNRVKLRFFAKKRVKHYFLFFEKITLSSYLIFSVIHNPLPAMSDFPNDSIYGIIYDINRKQHRSRFLAPSHHAMASVWVIPSKLLPSASAAYTPV
jgi:hypothetical protein